MISNIRTAKAVLVATGIALFVSSCGDNDTPSQPQPPAPDITPPAAVIDLAAVALSPSTIALAWSAPGDDGTSGTSIEYDIRFSSAAISASNWLMATPLTGEPVPHVSGTAEHFTVTGLTANTQYYFALKTRDEVPGWSALSNVAAASTPQSPDTTPPAAVTNLTANSTVSSDITITWTAPGDDGNAAGTTASGYDIRYSTSVVTAGSWDSATRVVSLPMPHPAGTSESHTVVGLLVNATYYFGIKSRDEASNWSGLSNVAIRVPDSTPPAAVANLAAGSATAGSLTLTWRAPGDDGSATGTIATAYDIRYSTSAVTDGNWITATPVPTPPAPDVAGTLESCVVTGLLAGTTYHFAIKTRDEVPNWSALSNGAMASTLAGQVNALVLVPAGTFTMGSPWEEPFRIVDESQHQVTLTHGFYCQSTEVTNQQYLELLQWAYANGYVTVRGGAVYDTMDRTSGYGSLLKNVGGWDVHDIVFSNGVFACNYPNYPVMYVSWHGAAAYCDWLSLQQGLPRAYNHITWQCNSDSPYTTAGYRLPTEAEWEYACRAGSTTAFTNGPMLATEDNTADPNLNLVAWYSSNAGGIRAVKGKAANAWGIYDMHGNLWEWCNDCYGAYGGAVTNPSVPGAGVPLSQVVMRGGSWQSAAKRCRSATREHTGAVAVGTTYGFRAVRSANQRPPEHWS